MTGETLEVQSCGEETGHARVKGTHSCRCGHRWFKYASAAEQAAGEAKDARDLYEALKATSLLATEKPPEPR